MPSWLVRPVFFEGGFQVWQVGAAFIILLAAVGILAAVLKRSKEKKRRTAYAEGAAQAVKQQMSTPSPLLFASMQGKGNRSEQQDDYHISPLEEYGEKGVLAVLCDGMGGMAGGKEIARRALYEVTARFCRGEPVGESNAALLKEVSRELYETYLGAGGTTLVMVYIRDGKLWFWSAGDSDLYLLREGRLYALNRRHELLNELLGAALFSEKPLYYAYSNPQKGSLTEYMGKEALHVDYSRRPLPLLAGDKVLLCSDGVSDTLELSEMEAHLALSPREALQAMEAAILGEKQVFQDNYTAVMAAYQA